MTSSPFDKLRAALDQEERTWEPTEPGEQIMGRITGIEYTDTRNGPVPVVVMTAEDGSRVRAFCGRRVLRRQLVQSRVQPGDLVGIRFLGERESKAGNRFFDYTVVVERSGPRRPDEVLRDANDDLLPPVEPSSPQPSPFAGFGSQTAAFADDEPNF